MRIESRRFVWISWLMLAFFSISEVRSGEPPPEEPPTQPGSEVSEAKSPPGQSKQSRSRRSRLGRSDSNPVGYIDNAIVGNQIRIRVSIAENANRPDRAEFFYGRCICFSMFMVVDGEANSPGIAEEVDSIETSVYVEQALNERVSLFVEVPIRSLDITPALDPVTNNPIAFDPSVPTSATGLSDIQVGGKFSIYSNDRQHLTLQMRASLPSGDSRQGLGNHQFAWEPGIVYFHELSNRAKLAAEFRWWHPFNSSALLLRNPDGSLEMRDFAGDILRYGLGLSFNLAGGYPVAVTPTLELVGWSVLDGLKTVPTAPFFESASGDTIVNLKPGVRIRFRGRSSVYLGYGFALTDEVWYDHIFRFEFRYAY